MTRNGAIATKWFPEVSRALASVPSDPDGKGCMLDDTGRRNHDRALRRRWYEGAGPVTYCVFDLLVNKGAVITQQPLRS